VPRQNNGPRLAGSFYGSLKVSVHDVERDSLRALTVAIAAPRQ
jgi:hypothetical protein